MGHVVAHDLPVVKAQPLERRVVDGKRRVVVDAQQRDLAAGVGPAQHALGVDPRQAVGPGQHGLSQQQTCHGNPCPFRHFGLPFIRASPIVADGRILYTLSLSYQRQTQWIRA